MSKPVGVMQICPGVINEGTGGHSMRDACYGCAPYWEQYPVCPIHGEKLKKSGYCRECGKYYEIPPWLDLSEHRGFK